MRYTLPPGTLETATLLVNPGTSGRHSAQGLKFRDAPVCTPLSLPLLPKTTEGPGRDLARSTSEATEDLRLAVPAAQPIGLRYWVSEVDKTRHWDLVVVLAPGKTYRVTLALPDRNGFKVHLERVDDPKWKASVSLEGYLSLKGEEARDVDENPDYKGFVSEYAKRGGPGENFAEMFAFYCMGRLPVLQSVAFEELCFGGGSGDIFTARKAFSRWLLSDLPG